MCAQYANKHNSKIKSMTKIDLKKKIHKLVKSV